MAKRAWVVRPDSEVTGIGPEGEDVVIPAVSLEALAGAVLEGVTIMHRAGGVVSVLASRVPTGFPNERVTSAAIVEWKDRTDARPQPESDGLDLGVRTNGDAPAAEPEPTDDGEFDMRNADETTVTTEIADESAPADAPDVDESSVPARLREA